jgi:hypothetical protein
MKSPGPSMHGNEPLARGRELNHCVTGPERLRGSVELKKVEKTPRVTAATITSFSRVTRSYRRDRRRRQPMKPGSATS